MFLRSNRTHEPWTDENVSRDELYGIFNRILTHCDDCQITQASIDVLADEVRVETVRAVHYLGQNQWLIGYDPPASDDGSGQTTDRSYTLDINDKPPKANVDEGDDEQFSISDLFPILPYPSTLHKKSHEWSCVSWGRPGSKGRLFYYRKSLAALKRQYPDFPFPEKLSELLAMKKRSQMKVV
jgi:hypothetical protein